MLWIYFKLSIRKKKKSLVVRISFYAKQKSKKGRIKKKASARKMSSEDLDRVLLTSLPCPKGLNV